MGERATIYHGTPMTPRAALLDVCQGRAMCMSFYRPDDVEAVEAIAPFCHVRQRGVFVLAGSYAGGQRLERGSGLEAILRLAGTSAVQTGPLGDHARYAGGALTAQRCTAGRMAVWTARRASVAHGWSDRAAASTVRAIRPGLPWLDRAEGRFTRLSQAHGGSRSRSRQPMARSSHATRDSGRVRLSFRKRRQYQPCAKRVAV